MSQPPLGKPRAVAGCMADSRAYFDAGGGDLAACDCGLRRRSGVFGIAGARLRYLGDLGETSSASRLPRHDLRDALGRPWIDGARHGDAVKGGQIISTEMAATIIAIIPRFRKTRLPAEASLREPR